MDLLVKLRKRLQELLTEMRGYQTIIDTERRALTTEEHTKFAALETEYDSVAADIEREERLRSREAAAAVHQNEPPAETRSVSGDGEHEVRGTESASGSHQRSQGRRPAGPFTSFGDQIQAVIRAGTPGGQLDQRLLQVRAPSGMNETVGFDGGYLVQQDFITDLQQSAFETGILSRRARRLPTSGNSNGIKINLVDERSRANGSRNGGILGYWVGEGEQKPSSKPKIRQASLQYKKLVGLCYLTDELMEDTVALDSWLRQAFADEFGFLLDEAIMNGSGVGQPLGIMNSPALITVSGESMQAAANLSYLNIVKMYARMYARGAGSAEWFHNQEVFPALALMPFDDAATDKSPVYLPANSAAGRPNGELLGRPMSPIEQASALGTVGDLNFFDLSQYLLIEKGPMQSASSIHVRFEYDEQVLRFVMRVDGQPLWVSAVTPYKGTNTVGPFVTLGTRNGS